jgi:hypothetical protein
VSDKREPSIADWAYAAILATGLVPKNEHEIGFLKKAIMLDSIINEPRRHIEIARAIATAQAQERERCAKIADEYAAEVLPVDPGGIARIIGGRIREGNAP